MRRAVYTVTKLRDSKVDKYFKDRAVKVTEISHIYSKFLQGQTACHKSSF